MRRDRELVAVAVAVVVVASLCCSSPGHRASWRTCAVNAAMFSCSVTLLVWERFAVAAAAAARAVFQSQRSAMQVVNMR